MQGGFEGLVLIRFLSYLTLVLQLLCEPSHDIDLRGREANRSVYRDVLIGAIRCKDPHVSLKQHVRFIKTKSILLQQ